MNTTPIDNKIEFIVWNTKLKKFVDIHLYCSISKNGIFKNDCILMQLTALRSINDEPIYNHMIVKDRVEDVLHCVDMFNYSLMHALSYCKLEIVGNRFQSPHLLELCK